MKSDKITQGLDRAAHRGLLYSLGMTKGQLKTPFIGIASSFSDLVPGHSGMRDLERFIEKGVHSAGGHSFIFGVPAVCDGIAMGHEGMRFSLPSRDLIADCVESVASAHSLDGLVLLSNCDKLKLSISFPHTEQYFSNIWFKSYFDPTISNNSVQVNPLSQDSHRI